MNPEEKDRMLLQILHTLTGFLLFFSFAGKIFLQYYLDNLHNRAFGFIYSWLTPKQYFLPYKQAVESKYAQLKYLCNLFFKIAVVSLLVNLIVGLIIFFA